MTAERLGDDLGHLEPVQVIGGGPAGLVYEAFDPRLGRPVALKTFRLDAMDPQAVDAFVARLRADTEAAAALRHPNIVEVYGCDRSDQTASLAMEFVQGETLAQHLARVGQRPPLQALALVAQLASALEAAHAHGLAHGRIAPEHLLVSRTGQLKLSGFGLPAAREQAFEADLAGMATLAHQLFTGAAPARPGGELPPPHQLRPELPAALDGVFARALAADPQSRYRSPAELFDALRTAFEPPLWERPKKAAPAPVAAAVAPMAPAAPVARPRAVEPAAVAPIPPAAAAKRPQPAAARGRNRLALVAASLVGVLVIGGIVLSGSFADSGAGKAELEQIAAAPEQASTAPSTPTPSSTAPAATSASEGSLAAPEVPTALAQPDARSAAPTPAPARIRTPETAAAETDTRASPRTPEPQPTRERVAEVAPEPAPARQEPAPRRAAVPAVPSTDATAVRREADSNTAAATAPPAMPSTPSVAATPAPATPAAPAAPTAIAGTNTAGAGPSPSASPPAAATQAQAGTSVASIEQRPPAASDGPQVVLRAVVRNERPSASNDPEAACRHQQLLIAREVCNVAQCQEPQWRNHPTCVRRLAEQRQRDAQADEALRTQ